MFENLLSVVDISPYIYSGAYYKQNCLQGVVECGDVYKMKTIKAGGVAFLLQAIKNINGSKVFCGERIPSVKRGIYPEYKRNRVHEEGNEVDKQRKLAEFILEDCGFVLEAQDGYEADDLVFSYWKEYSSRFEQVLLYVKDSDMHFMVNKTCNIMPVNSKAKLISMDNVESCSNSKLVLPYNSVVLSKVIFGDPKDNVPCVLPGRHQNIMFDLVTSNPLIKAGHDYRVNEILIRTHAPQDKVEQLLLNLSIVYPMEVDVTPPSADYDKNKFGEWCRALDIPGFGRTETSPRIARLIPELYETLNQV